MEGKSGGLFPAVPRWRQQKRTGGNCPVPLVEHPTTQGGSGAGETTWIGERYGLCGREGPLLLPWPMPTPSRADREGDLPVQNRLCRARQGVGRAAADTTPVDAAGGLRYVPAPAKAGFPFPSARLAKDRRGCVLEKLPSCRAFPAAAGTLDGPRGASRENDGQQPR